MKIQHASTSRFHNLKLSQERCFLLSMFALQGYLKGALRKKQLIAPFVEQFKLNFENTRWIDFQLHVANRDLCILSTIQDYVQGALRKNQLVASFVERLVLILLPAKISQKSNS